MHPNAQKVKVKGLLADNRIVTAAQLTRAGLARGDELLGNPRKMLTTMVRVNDSSSYRDVTYIARDAQLLDIPLRDLAHAAASSEFMTLRPLKPDEVYAPPRQMDNQLKNGRPDLLIYRVEENRLSSRIAVEFDLGYAYSKLMAKIKAIDAQQSAFTDRVTGRRGLRRDYEGYIIATTIHSRVNSLAAAVWEAYCHPSGEVLQNLDWVEIIWIDFWSATDRYGGRPNCHKCNRKRVTLMGA